MRYLLSPALVRASEIPHARIRLRRLRFTVCLRHAPTPWMVSALCCAPTATPQDLDEYGRTSAPCATTGARSVALAFRTPTDVLPARRCGSWRSASNPGYLPEFAAALAARGCSCAPVAAILKALHLLVGVSPESRGRRQSPRRSRQPEGVHAVA